MSYPVLHLRGIDRDDEGAIARQIDVLVQMTGLLPTRPRLFNPEERAGRRLHRRKGFRQKLVGQCYPTTVQASGWDYGDYRALEEVLVNCDEIYLVAEDTVFYRTNTTSEVDHNFWTGTNGILAAGDVRVECTSGPDLSPDFDAGTDKCTFTIEFVEPNT